MSQSLFVAAPPLPNTQLHHPSKHCSPPRKRPRLPTAQAHARIGVPAISYPPTTRRSARVSILTDFSSDPFAAIADRASDPLSAVMLTVAAAVGCLVSIAIHWRSAPPVTQEKQVESRENGGSANGVPPGENAIWLNMSLRTLWRLFRKSTNSLVKEVMQPVLDDMELPAGVRSVTITKLMLGESPALLRKIERLPSRSLSEIQYKFGLRLVGDEQGRIYMNVVYGIPGIGKNITVPVCVSSLDVEAQVWVGFNVVPYQPWVGFAQWALMDMPSVKLKVQVANYLPVTAIPFLSTMLINVLTKDVPREFLFPKTQVINLMNEDQTDVEMERRMLAARGVEVGPQGVDEKQLRQQFPYLSALFDTMDHDDDGVLNSAEVSSGLIDWGFASEADRNSIKNLLDVNNDGKVGLNEFVSVWGDLRNLFVPRVFRGVLSGVLLEAEGLRSPTFGKTDPYVVLQVESQVAVSKKNRATSKTGSGKGTAVWNEGWELFVQRPSTATLRVQVVEGCAFSYYRHYIAPPPEPTKHSGSAETQSRVQRANGVGKIIGYGSISISAITAASESLWIDLSTGGGRVRMDVQFSEFVDPQLP